VTFYSRATDTVPAGVRCEACGALTRTIRGQILHQAVCHGVYLRIPASAAHEPDPVGSDLPTFKERIA